MKRTEGGVAVHSFTCITSRVRGVCWSSKIGIRMSDKWVNYSYGLAQTKQQVGSCKIKALLVHGRTQIHKIHHGLNLREATIFPFIILYVTDHGGCTQVGSFEILEIGTLATLDAYNFLCIPLIDMTYEKKLYSLLRTCQQYVTIPLHAWYFMQLLTFNSREANWHFDSRPFSRP